MKTKLTQNYQDSIYWTTADLELLPNNGNRYEIIDGELLITRSPHIYHQRTCGKIYGYLEKWSDSTNLGEPFFAPGIVFSDGNNVEPDLVWVSSDRLSKIIDDSGHLTAAPELVVEVLSAGQTNERRDRELKLKLYLERGVREYWIVDWRNQQIEVYRRGDRAMLELIATLLPNDTLASPILPGFSCPVARLF
ncbi:Uma2 family endonuclease [Okeania sp.]|uniref:Uma2 family endonuclease n=1 Tax=Okeania sp. TaxID=3100323 RepID=UPI002B4ACFAD|nr:Uma2 family endonuclease [Okeania sp.]MEB3340735.1 Uma2 family endonuclease [Okeania sp.]